MRLVGDILRQGAIKFPEKIALIYKDKRISYRELNLRVNRLTNALLEVGVKRGDRIAVLADNCPQYVEVYFATAKGGMIIVPINTSLDSEAVSYILNNSKANTIIFGNKFLRIVDGLRSKLEELKNYIVIEPVREAKSYDEFISGCSSDEPGVTVDEDDIAWLMYTSGTTGPPKGVMLSHRNLISNAVNTLLTCFPINRNDVHLNVNPMFHMGCMWHMMCTFYMGGTNILLERLDPKLVLETIMRERVTTTGGVLSMIASVVNYPDVDKYDVSSMRMIIYSGAQFPEVERRAREIFGDIVMQVYAITEAGPAVIMPPLLEGPWEKVKRAGSCGKEVINVEVKLVNEEGNECTPGEVGEILVRGDNVMKGYWGMPEETAKTLEGGWLHTGDLATKDKEGYYYFTGRKKDVITSAGKLVYSTEVENVLSLHPSVSEAAVVGVPDKELGEAVKAAVVLKAGKGASEGELIGWCQRQLEGYKVPKLIHIVDSLPKNPAGKVLKNLLKGKDK